MFVLCRTGKLTASHFGKFHSDPSLRRSKRAGRRTCFNKAARFLLCMCLTTRRATPALFPQRERRGMPDGSPEEQLALNFREQWLACVRLYLWDVCMLVGVYSSFCYTIDPLHNQSHGLHNIFFGLRIPNPHCCSTLPHSPSHPPLYLTHTRLHTHSLTHSLDFSFSNLVWTTGLIKGSTKRSKGLPYAVANTNFTVSQPGASAIV